MSVVVLVGTQPGRTLELELPGRAWLAIPDVADRVEVDGIDFRVEGRRHRTDGSVELTVRTSHVLPEALLALGFTDPHLEADPELEDETTLHPQS